MKFLCKLSWARFLEVGILLRMLAQEGKLEYPVIVE